MFVGTRRPFEALLARCLALPLAQQRQVLAMLDVHLCGGGRLSHGELVAYCRLFDSALPRVRPRAVRRVV